jgi:hypothetical protein
VVAVSADQAAPTLEDVLGRVAVYHGEYVDRLSGVTLDEQYQLMDVTGGRTRQITRIASDVVLVNLNGQVAALRDPYALDTVPLREKEPRIAKLLAAPATPTRNDWQTAISYPPQGSVHFMLDIILKTNEPTLALQFAAASYQPNFKYKLDGRRTMDGTRVVGLHFEEPERRDHQYILNTRSNARATGRLWVDPATGAIHQTELWVDSKVENAIVKVDYKHNQALDMLLPVTMNEQYEEREGGGGPRQMGSGADPRSSVASRVSAQASARYLNPTYAKIDLTKLR